MRRLRKKFKKPGEVVIKDTPIYRQPRKIVKIKRIGRWCPYYDGRLPSPSECSSNKGMPISRLFKDGKVSILHDRSDCVDCKRAPEFRDWKRGKWDLVKKAISKGEDLTDMPSPIYDKE